MPFIKWVGGKSRLLPQLTPLLPSDLTDRVYCEPFLGGGAMYFHLQPRVSVLADINPHLITTYRVVRDNVEELILELDKLAKAHDKTTYYEVRRQYNELECGDTVRAAMFIYLNKTGFNGLHRTNKRGHFNVPMGDYKNPNIVDSESLRYASTVLQSAKMIACYKFDTLLEFVKPNYFIYLDPPYVPLSATSNFTGYATEGFSDADQVRLRDVCVELNNRGAKFMLSNSSAPRVYDLYQDFKIDTVSAPRSINRDGKGRACVTEVVVRNYDC